MNKKIWIKCKKVSLSLSNIKQTRVVFTFTLDFPEIILSETESPLIHENIYNRNKLKYFIFIRVELLRIIKDLIIIKRGSV